jgi:hypothetical protein
MDLKAFFEALKEYFLDVIGFLIPGIVLFLCLTICVNKPYFITLPILEIQPDYYTFLFIILNYVLGYLIYGFGVVKDNMLDRIPKILSSTTNALKTRTRLRLNKIPKIQSSTTGIELEIKGKPAFKQAFEKYNHYVKSKTLKELKEDETTCRELRSKAMSFLSNDNNNKIYRFMYQSDLCKHVGNVLLLIGMLGLINYGLLLIGIKFSVFNHESIFLFYYAVFICCYLLFRSARRYFYDKAIRTPFNMYMAVA